VSRYLFAILAILILAYLLYQIVNDALNRKTFFTFFERLPLRTKYAYSALAFLLVLSLWSFLSLGGIVDTYFLPTPSDTLHALWQLVVSGELLSNSLISISRILKGFVAASIIGVMIGSVAGTFARVRAFVLPLNSAIRYIPPTAFIGLAIVWFGIEETSKIFLIFIAIVFYITQMVADTVRLVPAVYIEAAQTLGANRWEIFSKVALAFSVSDILAVLRVNLGAAWTFLIVAEIVSAQQGLGYLMAVSQRFLQTPKLFALMFVVGLMGFITDGLLAIAINRSSRWK
jgi:NitT/TauT family transport system permease protein